MPYKRLIASLLLFVSIIGGAFGFLSFPTPVSAQGFDAGLASVGANLNLPNGDPRVIAARIINVALGTLGIIFVILIVYAGFLYLTSGGEADKTKRAIAIIRNSIIGLIIILLSWALARYILTRLAEAVGPGGGGTTPGGGGTIPGGGGSSSTFTIRSITPNGPVTTRKVIVKIVFSKPVDVASATTNGMITVTRISDGAVMPGTVTAEGSVVRFTSTTPCPAPNQDRFCFDENTDYRVQVSGSLQSLSGQALTCGGFAPDCTGDFRSGTTVDVTPPNVRITQPVNGFGVPVDSLVDVSALIQDETGVSYAEFRDNGTVIGDDAPTGPTPTLYTAHTQWDTAGLPVGTTRTLTSSAYDVDSGAADSAPVNVVLRATHCFNGVQDQGETGLDCGGTSTSPDYCGACTGGTCTVDTDCASGVCLDGFCVERPIITSVDPADGAPGSYVTLHGANFGTNGAVDFLGPGGTPVRALAPTVCSNAGVTTWSPIQVVIEVPAGAQSGPIRLTNGSSGLSDATNALPDPVIPDFIINDTLRPGICAVAPAQGRPGDGFILYGTGFGSTSAGIQFGPRTLTATTWLDHQISASVPNIAVGSYDISVAVGGFTSNAVSMNVVSPDSGGTPTIASIDPAQGPIGTMVTISGSNFGNAVGSVFFERQGTGEIALADTSLPEACSSGFWKDSTIVVKVPKAFTSVGTGAVIPGTYAVYVKTSRPTAPTSNRVGFIVNTDPLAPGICSVVPSTGPVGTRVAIYGEGFTNGPGTTRYFSNVIDVGAVWGGTRVSSTIPTGAASGPLTVQPSGGAASNPYTIQVRNCNESPTICSASETCCSDGACVPEGVACSVAPVRAMYAWQFSTGIIPRAPTVVEECSATALPSPSPWSKRTGGDQTCVNARPTIVFSTLIEPTTVTAGSGNIQLFRCSGGEETCSAAGGTPEALQEIRLISDSETRDAVILVPRAAFQTSTWYVVRLTTGIRGAGVDGLPMEERSAQCGAGNSYCYTFRTRGDSSPCAIGSVEVAPDPYTASDLAKQIEYHAVPRAAGDICQTLACEPYAWAWGASDARATVTHAPNPNTTVGGEACIQRVTPVSETGATNPVQITATASGTTGSGDLYIRLVPPRVVSYGPDCNSACVNAAIWASFNVPMDPATMNVSNIRIERCRNESCQELLNPPTLTLPAGSVQLTSIPNTSGTEGRFLVVSPQTGGTSMLVPGAFYRVILLTRNGSGIRSAEMTPLSELNHPEGFSWVFRVKQGDAAFCRPVKVGITPAEKYETLVGARQGFLASPFSEPDECSEQGQILMSLGGYAWSVDDVNVARLLNNGLLDTSASRVSRCNESCVPMGSEGQEGRIARCGDGVVQTTNASYCVSGRTRSGAACVVLAAGSIGSEECDEASALCNSRCLWEPVVSVSQGGTCGDGNVQATEDCDYGSTCIGASGIADGTDCTRSRAACTSAGGRCEPHETRGCSVYCRNLGSRAGGSTCGNADVADGEDCDDGNVRNDDGCSSDCVHEGSSRTITSLCGNSRIEPGESCERQAGNVWPAGCDQKMCLNMGSITTCGNGSVQAGEDCDDGNTTPGDGCSPICLFEGSSERYTTPSFCGDGVTGRGEFTGCETGLTGDGLVDAYQVAETVGRGTMDPRTSLMSTLLHATYQATTGDATYGLRCGYVRENQCTPDGSTSQTIGLSNVGCCSERPSLVVTYPLNNETDVCRNVLISGDFNVEMDTESLSNSFVVGQRVTGTACPSGQTLITVERRESPSGIKGVFARAWNAIKMFFGGKDAYAQAICSGGVSGRMGFSKVTDSGNRTFTRFTFTLDHVLDSNTQYTVIFRGDTNLGDNEQTNGKVGIRTASGVVSGRDWRWVFTTGGEICMVDKVDVEDTNAEHPGLFLRGDEAHAFIATARSWHGNRMVAISSTEEYQWRWQNWAISNTQIARLDPVTLPADALTLSVSSSTVVSTRSSGSGYVGARVIITRDSVGDPSTLGRVVQGTLAITVNTCENPWPSISTAPFRDEFGSPSLAGTPFASGPNFYNFSMMYCRDAGDLGPLGDLPSLATNAVATNAADAAQGILRQYLFTFAEPELKKDAIGIRIAANPLHLSPEEWYRSKGFTGKPQALTLDGYQAIRDGRTVYISAVSTDGPGADIYSNIYIISYNDGAESVTRQIYDALLSSLQFNRNIQSDMVAICQDAAGSIAGESGAPASCHSDADCDSYGDGIMCANFKAKVQRDLVRLADFEKMTRQLDLAKAKDGSYPKLQEGSYIAGMSTSLWPSWTASLVKAAGAMPSDPLNKFVTCGRCTVSNTACTMDSDCPKDGGTCQAQDGFDPKTCWNQNSLQFACAIQNTTSAIPTSRVYMYQAQDNGSRYRLSSEFEAVVPGMDVAGTWQPPLPTDVRQCVSGELKGAFCGSDTDCRLCPNRDCAGIPVVAGSCQIVGGSYRYQDICRGERIGQSTVCGDGVLSSEASTPEVCETTGPSSYRYRACNTVGGVEGYQRQVCNACREYIDDTKATCIEASQCGNGMVDGSCNGDETRPCRNNADCRLNGATGVCYIWERCDDGGDNGTYGHCNRTCSGYGASCGDGMLSSGEKCDLGSGNTEWTSGDVSTSCNLTCSGLSAFCGDSKTSAPFEDCDGDRQTTDKALCSTSPYNPCSTDADCQNGGGCGWEYPACGTAHVCLGGTNPGGVCSSNAECGTGGTCSADFVQTYRSRTCPAAGEANACRWAGWDDPTCRPQASCGNGVKEGLEECDDGNTVDTDACTTSCKKNACGDGFRFQGVEECDMGPQNGQGCSMSAEYGSTCTSCSQSCKFQLTQGGFCGDLVTNPGSSEQCDGNESVPPYGTGSGQLSCISLGYDYLKSGLDRIQCSQSCAYTGCAYCGDKPPEGGGGELYQGTAEGILFDTLFQQPVPGARVTLFYRGLQVAVTTSNDRGYFQFTDLDRHPGCNQYRITIDSYGDNKLTEQFNESKRGGYATIQTPPFTAFLESNAAESTAYLAVMTNAQIADPNTRYISSRAIPQFNMLPRLGDKEYIVQFWWDPRGTTSDSVIRSFRTAIGSGDIYNGEDVATQVAAASPVYGSYQNDGELHDLIVRTPFTYAPGTYAACSLGKKPKNFVPTDNSQSLPEGTTIRHGRNYTTYQVDSTSVSGLTNNGLDSNGDPIFYTGKFRPVVSTIPTWDTRRRDWGWVVGTNGVDQNPTLTGMLSCTNKIRASAGRVCAEVNTSGTVVNNFGRRYGCIVNEDCTRDYKFNLKPATAGNSIVCSNTASELERTGPVAVLDGREGAYLFCFHPEWPDGHPLRSQSQCSNFIVPPQSVFIHGVSGVYDVLISKFRMFVNGHANEPWNWIGGESSPAWGGNADNALTIRRWLQERNARIRVYDKNGLYQEYRYNDVRGSNTVSASWSPFDSSPLLMATPGFSACRNDSGFLPLGTGPVTRCTSNANCSAFGSDATCAAADIYARQTALERYQLLYPIAVSTVWTPLSVDVTNKQVTTWNNGYFAADYRYFADLFMNDTEMYVNWVGGGYNPATTAACVQFGDGTVEPNLADGWGICNGPDYWWSTGSSLACTPTDRNGGNSAINNGASICTAGSACQVYSSVGSGAGSDYLGVRRCAHACRVDADCPGTSGSQNFCVPRGGCAGVAGPYIPPSR